MLFPFSAERCMCAIYIKMVEGENSNRKSKVTIFASPENQCSQKIFSYMSKNICMLLSSIEINENINIICNISICLYVSVKYMD